MRRLAGSTRSTAIALAVAIVAGLVLVELLRGPVFAGAVLCAALLTGRLAELVGRRHRR